MRVTVYPHSNDYFVSLRFRALKVFPVASARFCATRDQMISCPTSGDSRFQSLGTVISCSGNYNYQVLKRSFPIMGTSVTDNGNEVKLTISIMNLTMPGRWCRGCCTSKSRHWKVEKDRDCLSSPEDVRSAL